MGYVPGHHDCDCDYCGFPVVEMADGTLVVGTAAQGDERLRLDDDEQAAMDALFDVHRRIVGWGLSSNGSELTSAVHVIQGFIVQRMLHRVAPDSWSDWYAALAGETQP